MTALQMGSYILHRWVRDDALGIHTCVAPSIGTRSGRESCDGCGVEITDEVLRSSGLLGWEVDRNQISTPLDMLVAFGR